VVGFDVVALGGVVAIIIVVQATILLHTELYVARCDLFRERICDVSKISRLPTRTT